MCKMWAVDNPVVSPPYLYWGEMQTLPKLVKIEFSVKIIPLLILSLTWMMLLLLTWMQAELMRKG